MFLPGRIFMYTPPPSPPPLPSPIERLSIMWRKTINEVGGNIPVGNLPGGGGGF